MKDRKHAADDATIPPIHANSGRMEFSERTQEDIEPED
jgi:hypothetical protein